MTIIIKPFEDITEVKIKEYCVESPLWSTELPSELFQKKKDIFDQLKSIDINHWERILKSQVFSINLNFGYANYYYNRGIPDDEWFIIPGRSGESVEYFPHFEEKHYNNQYNYNYFTEVVFFKAFTIFETIGHLLFKVYELPLNENNRRDKVSFNKAIFKLKKVNNLLFNDLMEVKNSNDFKNGTRMRNDIAHNHAPYRITSGVTLKDETAAFGMGDYTPSSDIMAAMLGILRSIQATFEVLETTPTVK
jgi:Cthe_2314-like HEPN